MVKSVQQSLRKAQIYLKNGELSKAEIVYKQILEKLRWIHGLTSFYIVLMVAASKIMRFLFLGAG